MDNLAHNGRPSGIIEDIVVKKDWQGKGIGKQMIEYAREKCKEAGCYKLALSSNIARDRAHKFYETLEFKKHGYSFAVDIDV
jgi:GNAT superfamily N-acetyltransferase